MLIINAKIIFIRFTVNMITFKSRNQAIRQADRITRSVNSIYPHVSQSRTSVKIAEKLSFLDYASPCARKMQDLQNKYDCKITSLQLSLTSGLDLFRKIIDALKNKKIGNCYESARMAEIIGKINGQENIYPMRMFISRNNSGALMPMEHVVSVITDSEIEPNVKYRFKNNDALILDPWLGLTEFAGKYLERIKLEFKYMLPIMPDVDFSIYMSTRDAKDTKEYKNLKKTIKFKPDIRFELHYDDIVSKEDAEALRNECPELILEKFKTVVLNKEKDIKKTV